MFRAIQNYFRAIPFIFNNGLAKYFLYALAATLVVIIGGAVGVSFAADWLNLQLADFLDHYSWLPDWAAWVQEAIYWLLWLSLRIALYFAMAFIGGSVILLLMSPVLTMLSEEVAVKLGQQKAAFSITQFTRDLTRAAGLAIKNGAIQLALTIACFFLGFIPVVGIAAPFLLFAINAYFFGFNFMDYSLERKKLSASESGKFIWKNKGKAIGLGAPFTLWLLIPFFGSLTSGFVAVIATVAATLEMEKVNRD